VRGVAAGTTVVGKLGVGVDSGEAAEVSSGAIAIVSAADVEIVVPSGGTEVRETEIDIAVATVVPCISCS
jgi:hypothetical protein